MIIPPLCIAEDQALKPLCTDCYDSSPSSTSKDDINTTCNPLASLRGPRGSIGRTDASLEVLRQTYEHMARMYGWTSWSLVTKGRSTHVGNRTNEDFRVVGDHDDEGPGPNLAVQALKIHEHGSSLRVRCDGYRALALTCCTAPLRRTTAFLWNSHP